MFFKMLMVLMHCLPAPSAAIGKSIAIFSPDTFLGTCLRSSWFFVCLSWFWGFFVCLFLCLFVLVVSSPLMDIYHSFDLILLKREK